jgi:hypothetical protein
VERRKRGCAAFLREWAERGLAPGQAINGNKRSLTLDLQAGGNRHHRAARRLADVVMKFPSA